MRSYFKYSFEIGFFSSYYIKHFPMILNTFEKVLLNIFIVFGYLNKF